MADAEAEANESQISFTVKASNDAKYTLTMSSSASVADIKAKLAESSNADIPVDRQRLIYSGRVLKDSEILSSTKIKDGHTIHLVKGAASNSRQNAGAAAQSSSSAANTSGTTTSTPPAAAGVPTNIAAGTGNNPLAALTGARYAGFHGLPNASAFGADGGMGPPPGPEDIERMLDNPNFLAQLNETMNNPAVLQMLENSPMMRDNPMARQLLRDPAYRRLLLNPDMIRTHLRHQRAMMGGGDAFPAPGVTDTTTTTPSTSGTSADSQSTTATSGQAAAAANPFAALFGQPPSSANADSNANPAGFANLFGPPSEEQIAQLQRLFGQGGFGAGAGAGGGGGAGADNLFGGAFSPFGAAAPPDNRPPEERYQEQLRQLNDMGFFEFDRNVQALRRSGGSVQGAIEYLLSPEGSAPQSAPEGGGGGGGGAQP